MVCNIYSCLTNSIHTNELEIDDQTINSEEENFEPVIMQTFPVDLDNLFWVDNLTKQQEILDGIASDGGPWPITPFGGHFVSNHIEGVDKWYIHTIRQAEIRAPVDGTSNEEMFSTDTTINIQGNEVYPDNQLTISLDDNSSVSFGHIDILKSIADEIIQENSYFYTEGELIGYTHNFTAGATSIAGVDFHYYYKGRGICPYNACTSEDQIMIENFHSLQYEAAKINGLYPESHLINEFYIPIEDTTWGTWQYKEGPYDAYYDGLDDWGRYEASYLTLLSQEFINPETYYRDIFDTEKNITAEFEGLMGDYLCAEDLPGFEALGQGVVELQSGNFQEGILDVRSSYFTYWGPINTSVYLRFQVNSTEDGWEDDLLTLEYFATLTEAENGFTSSSITYERYHPYASLIPEPEIPPESEIPTESEIPPESAQFNLFSIINSFVTIILVSMISKKAIKIKKK